MSRWTAATPEQMEEWGAQLAASRPAAQDAAVVVYLTGDLGAGKTTLARGFIRGCGIAEPVRSPTYALVEPYEGQHLTIVHLDLYRLRDPAELENLGLRDWAGRGHLWLIEWPEKAGARLPSPDLRLTLRTIGAVHTVDVRAESPCGALWLERANTT